MDRCKTYKRPKIEVPGPQVPVPIQTFFAVKEEIWVFEENQLAFRSATYLPDVLARFEELLSIACKNKISEIEVSISIENGLPSVSYDGSSGDCLPTEEFSVEEFEKVPNDVNKTNRKWTKLTLKPFIDGVFPLHKDMVALFQRRTVDSVACLEGTVNIKLNNNELSVTSFNEYVSLYQKTPAQKRFTTIHERAGDWCIALTLSDDSFQEIRFKDLSFKIMHGSPFDGFSEDIINSIASTIRSLGVAVDPKRIVKNLWLFIKTPDDDSSHFKISKAFYRNVAKALLEYWRERELEDMEKQQKASLADGTMDASKCSLILCEGRSSETVVKYALPLLGRKTWGVLPLSGKLPSSSKKQKKNPQFLSLIKVIGIEFGHVYSSCEGFNYHRIVLLGDPDDDGSHFKGLVLNFLYLHFPSLLQFSNFIYDINSPVIQAVDKVNGPALNFFSMPEFELWKSQVPERGIQYDIDHYKGLATQSSEQSLAIFANIEQHLRCFVWEDGHDECIKLAFDKGDVEKRKIWLQEFMDAFEGFSIRSSIEKTTTYKNFFDIDHRLWAHDTIWRSIPFVLDGLKKSQRKIVHTALKMKWPKAVLVETFASDVAKEAGYHHSSKSLCETITKMAQNHVGANNFNILEACSAIGSVGTRNEGGEDHGEPRYITIKLNSLARMLFDDEDSEILVKKFEDGKEIEPSWYLPILPVVLLNGSEGIGPGWSTDIPKYCVLDLIKILIAKLTGSKTALPLVPSYRGFKGSIKENKEKVNKPGKKNKFYITEGAVSELRGRTYMIEELPVKKWTKYYMEFLRSLEGVEIEEFEDCSIVPGRISIKVTMMEKIDCKDLINKLKLTTSISTNNMMLFDSSWRLKKFDTVDEILEEYVVHRLAGFEERKKGAMRRLDDRIFTVRCEITFVEFVLSFPVYFFEVDKESVLLERGFPSYLLSHLLNIPNQYISYGYVDELRADLRDLTASYHDMELEDPQKIWIDALKKFRSAWTG